MFCPNCGKHSNEKNDFCPLCGFNISKTLNNQNLDKNLFKAPEPTVTEKISTSSAKVLKPLLMKLKKNIIKYKKPLCASFIGTFVFIIGIILFSIFYDFTKISWDTEKGDANIVRTEPTTLTLNVLAYNKEKQPIKNIKFSAKNGKITSDGTTVKWNLPKKNGKYQITAIAPSGKQINKEVTVVNLKNSNENRQSLSGVISPTNDDKVADDDNDGITNYEEKKLRTNPNSADSDNDGISDYYEIQESKTNPLKADSDEDGINDGDELDLGLNPLNDDSKGDGIKDGNRNLNYNINDSKNGVNLEINGKGNIASTTIDVIKNSSFSSAKGLLDKVYNFYSNGTINNAKLEIKYNEEEIKNKNLQEDSLSIYYFNEKSKKLEILPTTVDKENKTLKTTLKHFSKYVIGDKNTVITNNNSQIMFVIDNSASMYSKNQLAEAGFSSSTGAIGNDIEFKRLTLTNKMVDTFTGNYKFGIAEFSGNYVTLKKFTNNREEIKSVANNMKSKWKTNINGTNIISALKQGINEFSGDENRHYLILLTDGKNTAGTLKKDKETIIANAKNKNVKVCIIGLGAKIDTEDLNDVAQTTGCNYYNANDSSALDEIYSLIGANINYNYIDTNDDNKVDGMIEADSGFIVNQDGFSFNNFRTNKSGDGNCYGMATFAMLYYKNQLPVKMNELDNSRFYLSELKKVDFYSKGYDLSSTYFILNNKLYNYKPSTEGLSILLNELPSDYRDRTENNTWMIKKEYYDKISTVGATISIKDNNTKDESFSKYQSAIINIDNNKFNNNVKKDERELLSAIWRLFILQADADGTSFSTTPDKAFEELKSSLTGGSPQVININHNHAINAVKIIRDINDANKFKLAVYDNNYQGETRYIDIIRSKYSKWQLSHTAWTNEYNYTFKYDTNDDGNLKDIDVKLSYPTIK